MQKQIALIPLAALLALGLTSCFGKTVMPPNPTHVDYTMGVSGQSWAIVLDGSSLGTLDHAGQTLGKDVSAGDHHFVLRDAQHAATSQSFPFSIATGQTLTYTLGSGSTTINWAYDHAHVDFQMGVSGQSWSIVLDGTNVGALSSSGQTLGKDLAPGTHSFYVRDAANARTSQTIAFSASAGQQFAYALGSNSPALVWTYDKSIGIRNLQVTLLSSNTVVKLSADFTATGYAQRTFAIGGYWLTYNSTNSTFYYVAPPSGYSYNTPSNYVGHIFTATPPSSAPYSVTPWFSVSTGTFPVRSSGTHYYGMFRVYGSSQVSTPNDAAMAQVGPYLTVWISFSLSPSGGIGEATVQQADGTSRAMPVTVNVQEPAAGANTPTP